METKASRYRSPLRQRLARWPWEVSNELAANGFMWPARVFDRLGAWCYGPQDDVESVFGPVTSVEFMSSEQIKACARGRRWLWWRRWRWFRLWVRGETWE